MDKINVSKKERKYTSRFFIREDYHSQHSRIQVCLRVSYNRKKFEVSLESPLKNLTDWDPLKQRSRKKHDPINVEIVNLENELAEAFNFLKYNSKLINIHTLKARFKKTESSTDLKLKSFLEDHYENSILKNNEYAHATKQSFHSALLHLYNFLKSTDRNHKMLSEVDKSFLQHYDSFLMNGNEKFPMHLNRNSANKYHIKFKTILSKALENKFITEHPYKGFKIKSVPSRITYLSAGEIELMIQHPLGDNLSLHRVRDIFLFSLYTGMRFTAARNLRQMDIEISGSDYWINFIDGKTGQQNRIVMIAKAVEIYDKYEEERKMTGFILPRFSNQKTNTYLKTIAELAGIQKLVTHHVARHSMATTIFLENDVSLEVTSRQLCHKSIRSTQIYAKITNKMLKKSADHLNAVL